MGQSPCDPPLGKQTQGGGSERDELHLRQRGPQQPAIPKPVTLLRLGRESVYNMWQLVHEIKNGEHPLFKEDTSINLFAYSIGALLSQVLLLANPDKMFTDTRLFMFCGGSIFSEMDGNARDIMDKEAFARYAITSGMISWRTVRFPPRSRMIFWSKPLRPWYVRMCYEITGSRSSNGLAIVFGRSH